MNIIMMRNKIIICFAALLLSFTSCDVNNNASSQNGKISKTKTSTTSIIDSAGKHQTDSTSNGQAKNKNSKKLDTNDTEILLYISLGCSILSLLLVIVALITLSKAPKWFLSSKFKDYIIDEIIDNSYKNKGRIFHLIENHNKNNSLQPNFSEINIELIAEKTIDRRIDTIVDKVLECIQLDNIERENKNIAPILNSSKATNNFNLFASMANKDNNSFFSITSEPDEDTIYKLLLSGSAATFVVYEGAYTKALQAPGCLECACEVQHSGNQSVVTEKPGTAERTQDGTWRIISKAKIKFN